MIEKTRLILVGGFLGSGKTTLLFETTRYLMQDGKKVGLITNDQASELVDTAFLLQASVNVAEVSGSCFCCNFNGFIESVRNVGKESDADYIIAEPVGSCTDLSATLMQPLKDKLNRELDISPLTVLADPFKLDDILNGGNGGLHPSAAYIFKKQLEESDLIVISKTDLLNENLLNRLKERIHIQYPEAEVLSLSSKTGEGIAEWLDQIRTGTKTEHRIIQVDYDTYAEGEAVLGWLNGSVTLKGENIDLEFVIKDFLNEFSKRTETLEIGIGHVKVIIENDGSYLIGNLTGTADTLSIRGNAGVADEARLLINARIELSPEILDEMVKEILKKVESHGISMTVNAWKCLSPGYPKPSYRYAKGLNGD